MLNDYFYLYYLLVKQVNETLIWTTSIYNILTLKEKSKPLESDNVTSTENDLLYINPGWPYQAVKNQRGFIVGPRLPKTYF